MIIELTEIESLIKPSKSIIIEGEGSFKIQIPKDEYDIELAILKNGQYIFVSLIVGELKYEIEHIEFYMNERKSVILGEFIALYSRLVNNLSRITERKKLFATKLIVELNENNEWVQFGYSANK